ncbi:MAG: prolipoprotein diacylglyceryl transferase [Chloroflexi bacterium]|nr:MAG: prolipoprotein diacylglyceryl transferase [Chloroflexota bacterium]
MVEKIEKLNRKKLVDGYWYVIGGVFVGTAVLFIVHLQTGYMPPSEAFTIPILNLPVYWYGIWIVGGISLGAYIITQLARERMLALFAEIVPVDVQQRTLSSLNLSDEIEATLQKQQIQTLGELLLVWGANSQDIKLKGDDVAQVKAALAAAPDVEESWWQDALWRQWYPDHVWNAMILVMILGVIGARLYHVMTPSPSMAAVGIHSPMDYFRNPAQLFNLRNGGLGIYGGLAGGALGLWIYTRRQRISMLNWTDLAVVAVSLGQAIGRWGNFFNQELYGRPTNLPWAIIIEARHRLPAFAEFERFHPAFLYESLWNLLTFGVLWTLAKKYPGKLMRGELTAFYLIFYAIGRILLETVRLDSRTMALGTMQLNMAVATFVSILIAIFMGGFVVWKRLR